MADENKVIELPVGKLVGTESTYTDKETGKTTNSITYRVSAGDIRAWEQREHGIDDKQRAAQVARNRDLGIMMSDFATDQFLSNTKVDQIHVNLGMGDGAEKFTFQREKVSHYPVKKDDGTVERAEKTVYNAMSWQTQRQLQKDVRLHHEANAQKIQDMVEKDMKKASLK